MGIEMRRPARDWDPFTHFLSEFLSAGRSVTLVAQAEDKARYDRVFEPWSDALFEDDRVLLEFMNAPRVAEVHQTGACCPSKQWPYSNCGGRPAGARRNPVGACQAGESGDTPNPSGTNILGGGWMWLNAGDEQILINLDQVRQIGAEGTSLVLVFAAGEKLLIRSFNSEDEAKNVLRHISHELMTTDLPAVR